MVLDRAAKRYAKALLSFAKERDEVEVVMNDVHAITNALVESKEMAIMMKSAVIPEELKIRAYKAMFADKVSPITLNFLLVIAKNSRSAIIPHILFSFDLAYKELMNIMPVNITTASKMDESLKADLINYLKKSAPEATIEISEKINEDLIGGFIFKTDTHQIDASVATRLKSLKRDLYNTTYTSKL